MTKVFANIAIDMTNLSFNSVYRDAVNSEFFNNVNERFKGVTYRDVFEVETTDGYHHYGGPSISANDDKIFGGKVTGYLETKLNGSALWGMQDFSTSALGIYNATVSKSTKDDYKILKSILSGDDKFNLSNGKDVALGFNGDDTMFGRGGNDLLSGVFGNDKISGGGGNDTILGGGGNDKLLGGGGADHLSGGGGKNTLNGGKGNDALAGGGKADTFVFGKNFGKDGITNFQNDIDTIRIDDANWSGQLSVNQMLDKFASVSNGDVLLDFGKHELRIEDFTNINALADDIVIF